MAEKVDVQYRIGAVVSLLLIILAIFLDITELVLDLAGSFLFGFGVVIGYAIDFAKVVLIPIIFLINGAPFWKGRKAKKKMIAMVTAFIISIIPWVGATMPETLVGVLVTLHFTRKEDVERAQEKAQSVVNSGITRARRMVQKVRRVRN